jgi:hypothetical protein
MNPIRPLILPVFLASFIFGCASYESIFPGGLTGIEEHYLSKDEKTHPAPLFDTVKLANLTVGKVYAIRLYNDSLIEVRVTARSYRSVTGISNYRTSTDVEQQQSRTVEQGEEVVSSFIYQETTTIPREHIKDILETRKKFKTLARNLLLATLVVLLLAYAKPA